MSDAERQRSDFYGALEKVDFHKLAERVGAPVEALQIVLTDVVEGLEHASLAVRPAPNDRIEPAKKGVSELLELLAAEDVHNRLVIALINEGRDQDRRGEGLELEEYVEAQSRVDEAYEALRDLAEIIDVALGQNLPPGRPSHEAWFDAAVALKNFWVKDLGREPTISGHRDDGRVVQASAFLRFETECLQQLGANLTEQGCRTLLLRLRKKDWDTSHHRPYGIT